MLRRCKPLITSPLVVFFSFFFIIILIQKGACSKLQPIWGGVPTFILAEFNYCVFFCFFFWALLSLSHSSRNSRWLSSFLTTMFSNHKSEPVLASHRLSRLVPGADEGRTHISGINHGLVHHLVSPQTNSRRAVMQLASVVSVHNLRLLFFLSPSFSRRDAVALLMSHPTRRS